MRSAHFEILGFPKGGAYRDIFARFITMWETQIIPRQLEITTPFRKFSRFSVWIPVVFAQIYFSRMVMDVAKILLYRGVPSLKKRTTNLQSLMSDLILIFLCNTPSNLCDTLAVKRHDHHHYNRRQHHHYHRRHHHLHIIIIIIIIISSVQPSLLTVCQFYVLFSYCKTHHQREESIQRLYLHRARLKDDKYLLSEEERVRFFKYLFMWCNIVTKLPMGSGGGGGGWIFQLLIQNLVHGLVLV